MFHDKKVFFRIRIAKAMIVSPLIVDCVDKIIAYNAGAPFEVTKNTQKSRVTKETYRRELFVHVAIFLMHQMFCGVLIVKLLCSIW